jgi:hypothetical protein
VTIRVRPAAELRARSRLFAALAEAFDVRFEADGAPGTPLISFGPVAEEDGPAFVVEAAPGGAPARRAVRFGSQLDPRLRGRTLMEDGVGDCGLAPQAGDEVLATVERRPVWLRRGAADIVAHAPAELAPDEVLRDRLDPGRFLGLLPLVHFLRAVCAPGAWQPPPARAAFVVDDPNLHGGAYGHLRYRELVADAREHGYHVAIAMVPFDGWYAHRPTVRLFKASPDAVSLCVHGNDHRMHELGRPTEPGQARRILAQSARRVAAFERRTGLPVSRVMVPPYEACSAASMGAMLELGFEAITHTRPYPWLPLGSPHAAPDPAHTLSGWRAAELMEDGLPVLIRRELHEHDEIVLRSFLDQPILLYGHVSDFAGGLEPLRAAAAVVNSLPSVTWGSLADVAARNFESRRDGGTLEIRPYSRRIRVQVGPGVERIRLANGFEVEPDGESTMQIHLRPPRELSPASVRRPPFAPEPVARRLLVEARDRLGPVVRRLKAAG